MAASPPDLSERQTCHKARDNYFNCLDTHNDVASSCEEMKKAMQAVCRPTWVVYFCQHLCVNIQSVVDFVNVVRKASHCLLLYMYWVVMMLHAYPATFTFELFGR